MPGSLDIRFGERFRPDARIAGRASLHLAAFDALPPAGKKTARRDRYRHIGITQATVLGAQRYRRRDQIVSWQNWMRRPHAAARGTRQAASEEPPAGARPRGVHDAPTGPIEARSVPRGWDADGAADGCEGSEVPHAQCSPQVQDPARSATQAAFAGQHAVREICRSWQQRRMRSGLVCARQQAFAASDLPCF